VQGSPAQQQLQALKELLKQPPLPEEAQPEQVKRGEDVESRRDQSVSRTGKG
jgi:hypothetical protein